jgi:hypothetical protein
MSFIFNLSITQSLVAGQFDLFMDQDQRVQGMGGFDMQIMLQIAFYRNHHVPYILNTRDKLPF